MSDNEGTNKPQVRYTCSDEDCPCMLLAMQKDQLTKHKGRLVYYFTDAEIKEINWHEGDREDCNHEVIPDDKGIDWSKLLKPLGWLLLIAAVVGAIIALWPDTEPNPDNLEKAKTYLQRVCNETFPNVKR